MTIKNYRLPKYLPKDVVLFFEYYDSHKPVPILATVKACYWDERAEGWRYHLSGITRTPLEEKLVSYERGIFIQATE